MTLTFPKRLNYWPKKPLKFRENSIQSFMCLDKYCRIYDHLTYLDVMLWPWDLRKLTFTLKICGKFSCIQWGTRFVEISAVHHYFSKWHLEFKEKLTFRPWKTIYSVNGEKVFVLGAISIFDWSMAIRTMGVCSKPFNSLPMKGPSRIITNTKQWIDADLGKTAIGKTL